MKHAKIILLGLTLVVSAFGPAKAAETVITLSGNSEHINVYNVSVFGYAPGSVITDAPFTETVTIDPAGGGVIATANAVASNSILSSVCCAVSFSVRIGGQTFSIAGTDYSGAYAGVGQDFQALSDDTVGGDTDNSFYLDLTGTGVPTSLNTAFPTTAVSETYGTPIDAANDGFSDNNSLSYLSDASGELYPTTISIAIVPEPGAWSLLIAGVGVTGGFVRRRHRSATLAIG
jgi:hypothetical protein